MIDDKKYNRTIQMHCPTCGGTEFEDESTASTDGVQPVKCVSCGLVLTKSDLEAANAENINLHLEEVKKAVLKDVEKSLKDIFKGWK